MAARRVRGDLDWQTGKSVLECNLYMLENELATDCCFEVGPQEGEGQLIRAHTYMLVSRSPVFEAMFCGGLADNPGERKKIRITDIEPDIFRDMLKFIYCEEVDTMEDRAIDLLYSAKKYQLTTLEERCQKFLSMNMDVENIWCILEQSVLFDESDLKASCLEFIGKNSNDVLQSSGFLQLSRSEVAEIVSLEQLSTSETDIYEACVKWAKHQLGTNTATSTPSDLQVREVLDDVLYMIRFPTMDINEFARLTGSSDVLSGDEKSAVYYYFATRQVTGKMRFNAVSRRKRNNDKGNKVICRFTAVSTTGWNCAGSTDAIQFSVNKNVTLTGMGLYGGVGNVMSVHNVTLEVWDTTSILSTKTSLLFSNGSTEPITIQLDDSVNIVRGYMYTIVAKISGPNTYHGLNGRSCVHFGDVIFIFSRSSKSGNCGTDVTRGQIPQLIFK